MSSSPRLTLVIPCYNEAAIIARNASELVSWMAEHMPETDYELLLINDGSRDDTGAILDRLAAGTPNIRAVHHKRNFGRGRAIRTGFENARGDYVICLDADLSYSPEHIPRLLDPLVSGRADITLASAYHPEGEVVNVPFLRARISRWGNAFLRWGTYGQLYTVTCVVRGYTRDVVDTLELISSGKESHLEVVHKAPLLGFRLVEVPARLAWRDRKRKGRQSLLSSLPGFGKGSVFTDHLMYNFVLRPSLLALVPIAFCVIALLLGTVSLFVAFINRFSALSDGGMFDRLYISLRETLLGGQVTLTVMIVALILLLFFVVLTVIAHINKRNFNELYVLISRMNRRIKALQHERDD